MSDKVNNEKLCIIYMFLIIAEHINESQKWIIENNTHIDNKHLFYKHFFCQNPMYPWLSYLFIIISFLIAMLHSVKYDWILNYIQFYNAKNNKNYA